MNTTNTTNNDAIIPSSSSSLSTTTTTQKNKPNNKEPLSWTQARIQMRHILQSYINETCNTNIRIRSTASSWKYHVRQNLDVYCGSILLSTSMLIVSILSEKKRVEQIVASIIICIISISNAWLIHERDLVMRGDVDRKKHKIIASFLPTLNQLIESPSPSSEIGQHNDQQQEQEPLSHKSPLHLQETTVCKKLSGTSLTDIYPVYRTTNPFQSTSTSLSQPTSSSPTPSSSSQSNKGEWYQVPSLLLVKGDFIALKIGDIAPANCTLVPTTHVSKKSIRFVHSQEFVQMGEKITSPLFSHSSASSQPNPVAVPVAAPTAGGSTAGSTAGSAAANTTGTNTTTAAAAAPTTARAEMNIHRSKNICHPLFPPNKCTLMADSPLLLNLCSNTRVYIVQKTPLDFFLRKSIKGPMEQKSPQIHRKLQNIRLPLYLTSIGLFLLTLITCILRHIILQQQEEEQETINYGIDILYLPLLTCIGTLPIMTPMLIYIFEIIGTCRILVKVHLLLLVEEEEEGDGGGGGEEGVVDDDSVGIKKSSSGGGGSGRSSTYIHLELFMKYFMEGIRSRFILSSSLSPSSSSSTSSSSDEVNTSNDLIDFPIASSCFFEQFGVVTALAVVDDELACDPISTPQQLLIPTSDGLKLLDMFPKFEDADLDGGDDAAGGGENDSSKDDEYSDDPNNEHNPQHILNVVRSGRRRHTKSFGSSKDSDSDWGGGGYSDDPHHRHDSDKITFVSRRAAIIKALRRKRRRKTDLLSNGNSSVNSDTANQRQQSKEIVEVQFEDPNWWHYLPSLKCIGLSCLLLDREQNTNDVKTDNNDGKVRNSNSSSCVSPYAARSNMKTSASIPYSIESSLVQYITQYYSRAHLLSLSKCIGFTTSPNSYGLHGDLSPFIEKRRLHIIATRLLKDRMNLDRHAIGLEESRAFGLLRPDSTSLLVQDNRSNAYQLLTLGDPEVVTELCSDTWKGEAITPFGMIERHAVLDSAKNLNLADLDVTAFSYAPIPYTLEQKFRFSIESKDANKYMSSEASTTFLIDNRKSTDIPLQKDAGGDDWSLVRNQIFVGLLGSSVSPRKEIIHLIETSTKAGIRFVYFSPRNMRRCKELASQMGIEMSWNCAISLRPLHEGQDIDEHRMTSSYADWVTNAKLPNGVENVKKHLEEVDNVPLLVSLFTDVTKGTTSEMVTVFEEYNDTVLSIGLSHISQNDDTYSVSNVSIGLDILQIMLENAGAENVSSVVNSQCQLDPNEISFISAISSHSCVFQLPLEFGLLHLHDALHMGRAALNASTSAFIFILSAYLSFGFFILFSTFSSSTMVPHVSALECIFYLLIVIPFLGIALTFTEADDSTVNSVPQKNDVTITWLHGELSRTAQRNIIRALLPAIASQLSYIASFVPVMVALEPDLVMKECNIIENDLQKLPLSIIRCKALSDYDGVANYSLGRLMLAELSLCTLFLSASYLLRFDYLSKFNAWKMNRVWVLSSILYFMFIVLYVQFTFRDEMISALPWYVYIISFSFAVLTLIVGEMLKKPDIWHEDRAEKLRRLQFETRLGMWSPK